MIYTSVAQMQNYLKKKQHVFTSNREHKLVCHLMRNHQGNLQTIIFQKMRGKGWTLLALQRHSGRCDC